MILTKESHPRAAYSHQELLRAVTMIFNTFTSYDIFFYSNNDDLLRYFSNKLFILKTDVNMLSTIGM